MLHENHPVRAELGTLKGIKGYRELPPFGKFVTEVLIFRSSRSLMFFKIGVLKSFVTFTGKHPRWPLQVFFYKTSKVAASAFSGQQIFQLNLVFTADSHSDFCFELLQKHELNLRSSQWNSSAKKVSLEILQISQESTCVEVSF